MKNDEKRPVQTAALLAPRGQVTDLLASQDENEGETSPIGKALLERKRCASEGGGAHRGADAGNTLGAGRCRQVDIIKHISDISAQH